MKLIWLSNDYCYAIYDEKGNLLTWGQFGDDPVGMLEGLGFHVEVGDLKDLDGDEPPVRVEEAKNDLF